MSSGVHPAEWIFPVVGGMHTAYNVGAQAFDQADAKLTTPGSKESRREDDRRLAEGEEGLQRQAAEQAERDRIAALPQTPGQQQDSRKRAQAAASTLLAGGRRRASQTLTEAGSTLSGSY
jgi:hypothetical protein